jgi:UDP-N-acetylmuramyl tripeptide synthase
VNAFRAKVATARVVGSALRRAGRGGTSFPGKLLLRLDGDAIGKLADGLSAGSVTISATNGKTTTTALARSILAHAQLATVDNFAGANMAGGIASALLGGAVHGAAARAQLGLFEVDEFWLPSVVAALRPRAIVLSNLFRDQLDRFGELETIGERWAQVAAATPARLVLGADDPLVAELGAEAEQPLYFGIEDPRVARRGGLSHASDSKQCRRCGGAYRYEHVYIGHLGVYACSRCGQTRPVPSVGAHNVTLDGVRASHFELRTPAGNAEVTLSLPGLYNVYNALAAAALATALEIPLATIVAGLASTTAVFGRAERVLADGHEVQILLVKNPAGTNEVLRTLALEPGQHHVLGLLNDQEADGRDVSWIWDADFEDLAARVGHVTCAGSRGPELALRLKYAGVPTSRISVEQQLSRALDQALAGADGQTLYALPTYTAMLDLRDVLTRRGHTTSSWTRR